jgi:hypothetical protein
MAKKGRPNPQCATCRYFDASTRTRGRCRINPPQASGPKGNGVWPTVGAGDWCGAFKQKKAAK